jgi:hypothetical protein
MASQRVSFREGKTILLRHNIVVGEPVNEMNRNDLAREAKATADAAAPPREVEQWKKIPLTPECREWAIQQFTEEEIVAGLRELREQGGLELRDFLPELEKIVAPQ